jgi:hypothetical protein
MGNEDRILINAKNDIFLSISQMNLIGVYYIYTHSSTGGIFFMTKVRDKTKGDKVYGA